MKNRYGPSAYDEKPFNQAEALMQRLATRFDEANQAAMENDPHRWYRTLRSIYRAISFVKHTKLPDLNNKKPIDKDTKEPLTNKTLLKNLKKKLDSSKASLLEAARSNNEVFYYDVERRLEIVEINLISLAYRNKIYYPHYQNTTWQETAENEPT